MTEFSIVHFISIFPTRGRFSRQIRVNSPFAKRSDGCRPREVLDYIRSFENIIYGPNVPEELV